MGGGPLEGGVHVTHREGTLDAGDDPSGRMAEPDVDGEETVDPLDETALGHRVAAAAYFLGRLEEDGEPTLEVARLHALEDGEPPRHVDVVSARVHRAVDLRAEPLAGGNVLHVVGLLDEQRVDVDAKPDRGAVTAVEGRHAAGDATGGALEDVLAGTPLPSAFDPWVVGVVLEHGHPVVGIVCLPPDREFVDADPFDLLDEPMGGVELAPAGLRMAMEPATQFDQPIRDGPCHVLPWLAEGFKRA